MYVDMRIFLQCTAKGIWYSTFPPRTVSLQRRAKDALTSTLTCKRAYQIFKQLFYQLLKFNMKIDQLFSDSVQTGRQTAVKDRERGRRRKRLSSPSASSAAAAAAADVANYVNGLRATSCRDDAAACRRRATCYSRGDNTNELHTRARRRVRSCLSFPSSCPV